MTPKWLLGRFDVVSRLGPGHMVVSPIRNRLGHVDLGIQRQQCKREPIWGGKPICPTETAPMLHNDRTDLKSIGPHTLRQTNAYTSRWRPMINLCNRSGIQTGSRPTYDTPYTVCVGAGRYRHPTQSNSRGVALGGRAFHCEFSNKHDTSR
jgi:hypothetical protein